jgi:hypothetical protein
MAPTVPEQVQGEPALEIEPITREDVGSWPGQEQRLRFKACELCNGINHYSHCYYWSRGDRVGIIGHSNFCTPEWLVEKKAKGQWKGRIIIPQRASGRFLKAGEIKLPGYENMVDIHFCVPQKSMQAFDRMNRPYLDIKQTSGHQTDIKQTSKSWQVVET